MSRYVSGYNNGKDKDKDDESKDESKKDEPKKDDKPAQSSLPFRPSLPQRPQAAGALKRTSDLLERGGFTRALTWRDRRALKRIERSARAMRSSLLRAFAGQESTAFVRQACDSLAHIEITSRLELMAEPERKKDHKP